MRRYEEALVGRQFVLDRLRANRRERIAPSASDRHASMKTLPCGPPSRRAELPRVVEKIEASDLVICAPNGPILGQSFRTSVNP